MLVLPCLHHVEELPTKAAMRKVSGRSTTGPGESIFVSYVENQNEIRREVQDHELKKFPWDQYRGTPVEIQAKTVIRWAKEALANEEFSRGDYR